MATNILDYSDCTGRLLEEAFLAVLTSARLGYNEGFGGIWVLEHPKLKITASTGLDVFKIRRTRHQ